MILFFSPAIFQEIRSAPFSDHGAPLCGFDGSTARAAGHKIQKHFGTGAAVGIGLRGLALGATANPYYNPYYSPYGYNQSPVPAYSPAPAYYPPPSY